MHADHGFLVTPEIRKQKNNASRGMNPMRENNCTNQVLMLHHIRSGTQTPSSYKFDNTNKPLCKTREKLDKRETHGKNQWLD